MSDQSQGPGWWMASDGKWYPPHAGYRAPDAPAPVLRPPTEAERAQAASVQPPPAPAPTGSEPAADDSSSNRGLLTLAALIVAAVVIYAVFFQDDDSPEDDIDLSALLPVEVIYEAEGTASHADVTMETPTGVQQDTPDIPIEIVSGPRAGERGYMFRFRSGDYVYMSAQNQDSSGTISCRITAGGVVISENESRGGYAIATCSGTVP